MKYYLIYNKITLGGIRGVLSCPGKLIIDNSWDDGTRVSGKEIELLYLDPSCRGVYIDDDMINISDYYYKKLSYKKIIEYIFLYIGEK